MEKLTLKFSVDDLNLILESLGNMPFVRVHQLIGNIQQQASAQLQTNGQAGEMQVDMPDVKANADS